MGELELEHEHSQPGLRFTLERTRMAAAGGQLTHGSP